MLLRCVFNIESKMDNESDREAIIEIRSGDKEAYKIIVNRYMKKAFYTALGFAGNSDDAADLSQEAFVRAYRAISKFDIKKPFFPWFYRILRNVCLNYKRKKRRLQEVPIETVQCNESQSLEKESLSHEVWNAISQLRVNEKEIILLKYFQRLSCKEIAKALDCPIGTVMSRLYYARKQLKEKLKRII